MNISSRLHIVAILPVLLVVVIACTLLYSARAIHDAVKREQGALSLTRGIFELDVLAHEYISQPFHGTRAREQWKLRHQSLTLHFTDLPVTDSSDRRDLKQVLILHSQLGDLFARLEAQHEETGLTADKKSMSEEMKQRLIGQIQTRSQSLVALASHLAESADARKQGVLRTGGLLILASVVVTAALLVLISLLISRSITKPIHQLHMGTEMIGRGHFDHRVGTDRQDEIGQLSRAFDRMVANLKSVTASRDELDLEVAERKRAEETIRSKSEELERSNGGLEQFAYVASHDLQEPLRAVSGCLQLLEQRYKGKLDTGADQFISHAVDGALRMQVLIHGLLEYSRVGTGGEEFEEIDSEAVLNQAITNLQVAIEESGAVITHDPIPSMMADGVQLSQLFQNLIGNAIKFHSDKPPEIHTGVEPKNGEWQFSVRDNGIGIESQYAERIFGVFQRLHTREEYSGTGIGLAICKKIVERHGGRMWLESELEHGSKFYFTIPRNGGITS